MDNSTEGVTLLTGFVFDLLGEYEHMRRVCAPAFEMAKGLDKTRTDEWCSIQLYNDLAAWIEKNVGAASIRQAGLAIGVRISENIVKNGKLTNPSPLTMMESLKWAADTMVRDPKKRGFEILAHDEVSIRMRRTQTFNCKLQDGLLLSLIERTGVDGADVVHEKCTDRGDEFCEYRVSWL